MKKASHYPINPEFSPLAVLCLSVFGVSTLIFAYLFFYTDFQRAARSFKQKQTALGPVFSMPPVPLPRSFEAEIKVPSPALEEKSPASDNSEPAAQKVFVAYELGDFRLASQLIADFISSYPESPLRNRVRLIGANIMNNNGDTSGALAYIKKILTDGSINNEDFTDTVLLLGSIAREKKQYDSYIQTYLEQAYFRASEPTRSKLAFYLGYLLLNKKDYATASKYFNNVIGEDGVLGRAELYTAEEKRPETINTLAEFLDQYPASANYDYAKAAFLEESRLQAASLSARGYADAALAVFQKIAARFPQSKEGDSALLSMADLYERKLDPARMKASLEKILDNQDNFYDPDALFRLGKLAFTQDNYAEALGYFRTLAEKYPTSPLIKETLDWQKLILDTLRS